MREVHKHMIYFKVPIKQCWEKTGKALIKTRWLDINKGDKMQPEYRSRLVAKDFKEGQAARLVRSHAAVGSTQVGHLVMDDGRSGMGKQKGMENENGFIDIERAYFHAEALREIHVELLNEDKEEGMCGKLLNSMYGTRDAAHN